MLHSVGRCVEIRVNELWHHSHHSAHHKEDNHRTPFQDPQNLAQMQHVTNKGQNQQ